MKKKPISYYHDDKFEKRITVNEEGDPILDWGETIPGQTKLKTVYVKNESKDRLILRQPFSTDESLKILTYPANLHSEEKGIMKFSLTPHIEKIESHHGSWGFEIIIG